MPSAFDIMDRRHRPPEPIRAEPMQAGEECPGPKCRGRMEWTAGDNALGTIHLACDCCGWMQERRT